MNLSNPAASFGTAAVQGLEPSSAASVPGFAIDGEREKQKYKWTRELDQLLRDGYRTGPDAKQRAIDQICIRTGWPRQACWDRARALQLTGGVNANGRKRWTPAEIAQLTSLRPRTPISKLAQQMGRTLRSVREKLKRVRQRMDVDFRPQTEDDGYTITEVAEAIGRSARTVYRWVSDGRLSATPEPVTGELCVEEDDFWRFVTLNYQEVLVHKVSRDYLEWLCAELLPLARPRISQKGGRKKRASIPGVQAEIRLPATSLAPTDSFPARFS
jgi:transposase-like protein